MRGMFTVLALASFAGGCNNPVYLSENRPLVAQEPPVPKGQTAPEGGILSDTDLFVLPFRKPTDAERAALAAEQAKLGLPMPVPWIGLRDIAVEINYTIKNLDATDITARVTLNGGNEFGDYDKKLFVNKLNGDNANSADVIGNMDLQPVVANGTRTGVFREDQMHEAGIDLEAITRYPAPGAGLNEPFEVLERLSTESTIGLEGVPAGDITPAYVRIQILLEATGHAVLDYSVRVRENGTPGDKLAQEGAPDLYVSTDAVLVPPTIPMQPTMADDN